MTSGRSNERLFAALIPTALLPALIAAGCGGDAKNSASKKSTGGTSGTSTSGGSSNGGLSGDAGAATGGSSGTDATGGIGGEGGADSGGTSTGGAAGTAGSGGMAPGGSGGTSQGGTAGGGAAGMTGTIGDTCSPRGALACAGNHQKVTVLCGADGTWQPNETCGGNQFCDSTPGPNAGTCQLVAPGCEDGAGTRWCDDDEKHLVTCGPDAVTTIDDECSRACRSGECRNDLEECPTWENYAGGIACSRECDPPNSCSAGAGNCLFALVSVYPTIVRVPWTDDACACSTGTGRRFLISLVGQHNYVRASVSSPWGFGECGEARTSCRIVSPTDLPDDFVLWADGDGGPVNVLLEEFDTQPQCP